MKAKADALLDVAMSVADGSALGWRELEQQSTDSVDRAVLHQLRIVARIAAVHKSQATDSLVESGDAPARWGHYLLLEQLGDGAFGDVYLARDTRLDRLVAIKLLRARSDCDPGLVHRMLREARALAQVRHPNVVTVYGAEIREGCVGLSMEFVRGSTIDQILDAQGLCSGFETAVLGMALCRALAAVHAEGLVHGDVKAQNVMREDGGRLVLMDFGSGQRPQDRASGQRLTGTPLYVAPEVLSGEPASIQSDIYSTGVLLYHLATNRFPIEACDQAAVREAHAHGRAVRLGDARPTLPDAFCRVIDRALDPNPARRYDSARALQADLARAYDLPIEPPSPMSVTPRDNRVARVFDFTQRRNLVVGTLILAVFAVVATLGMTRRNRATAGGPPPAIQSIAVLPLANVSGNQTFAYFVDGMSDELITTLGRMPALRVTSWTSVLPFRASRKPAHEIGRALHVDAVLEGSVSLLAGGSQTRGGRRRRVRVSTRLVYAATDTLVWSHSFDRDVVDTPGLQSDIARAVAREIHTTLSPHERRYLAPMAVNAAAQDAYLQGRYLLDQYDKASLQKALALLQQAVSIDPGYARAWSALSRCYVMLELVGALARPEARALGMAAGSRALDLDETLPSAHDNLADLNFYYDWDWHAAERGYQRALEFNPSDAASRADYARLLAAEGRMPEALHEAKQARELDPLSPYATSTVGMMFYYARRYDEAIGELRRAIQLAPPTAPRYLALGRVYADHGSFLDAVPALQRAVELSHQSPDTVAELARALVLSGDRSAALDLVGKVGTVDNRAPESLAYVYAALGDRDQAMNLLQQAIAERAPRALWTRVDPRLDPVRSDPRFAQIVEQLGNP